jgi:DNA replication protein DnaC
MTPIESLKEETVKHGDRHFHEELKRSFTNLKLTRLPGIYQHVFTEAAAKGWSLLHTFAYLIRQEAAHRPKRVLECRIKRARLPKPKTLEDYDFTYVQGTARQKILRMFDCRFVDRCANYVLMGPHGTGKTHLLTALGYVACRKGISVRFTRAIDMINTLTAAQTNGALGQALRAYTNPSLLLLDELEYLPVDKRGADLMFQVVAARYEAGSIAITTNRPFIHWGKILDMDNTLAAALIDRLMHHGDAILIRGRSYRMNNRNEFDHAQ